MKAKWQCLAVAVLIAGAGVRALGQEGAPPAEMQLPPGWTQGDVMAFAAAATPGEMHARLAAGTGTWRGRSTMWMAPNTEPMAGECTFIVTPIMGGRYVRGEMSGELPGMGPFIGEGVQGFDNVAGKFVATWVDSNSTGIMQGVGELSEDGRTTTWEYTYSCAITRKPTTMRQVETVTGPDSKTLEMFGRDPKTGEAFQMMRLELTREAAAQNAKE